VSNQRYRYLLPEEQPRLMAALDGPRAHLKPAVIVALGTGMRLMGHSDTRMTARYVRGTERNKRAAVEAVRLDFQVARHNGVTRQEQPPTAAAVSA